MWGGRDEQDVGLVAAPAGDALALVHQTLQTPGDAGGVDGETLLGVVGAQHDDQQIHRLVAHEDGVCHIQGGHGFVEGVGEDGGAAGQTLFQDQIVLTQCLLQQAGPAFVFVEAGAAVGAVGGIGAVAVGIGVTETDDVFFHGMSSLCIDCPQYTTGEGILSSETFAPTK